MTSGRRLGDDGSAVVEFVVLGMVMLLPLMYLVLTLGRIQAAAYATAGGARAAARAMATAPEQADGLVRARQSVELGLRDQGFDTTGEAALTLTCSASPCLSPQGRIEAAVHVDVVLPGVPALFDAVVPTHVSVTSRHVVAVDYFRAAAGRGSS